MSKLNAYSESFKVGYEKFLIGCDAQEEMDGWDTETDGEMEGYYSNILVSVVMKLMASDGVFTEKEVEYFIAYKTDGNETPQLEEIEQLEWLNLEEAKEQVTYDRDREILLKVQEYLKK